MPRYFIEVSYKGTAYSGFQVQKNSNTIQSEIEKALEIFFKQKFTLTGSSRTDAGVHALQNYFHFDVGQFLISNRNPDKSQAPEVISFGESVLNVREDLWETAYHLNAILPRDIVVKRIFQVAENAHCRFDAASREYKYFIYSQKNPFLEDRAYYFPYKLDVKKLDNAATLILEHRDFTSFSKKHTQVNNFICEILKSEWALEKDTLVYTVKANRFLRGMVKGLVGTMLRVGTDKISLKDFGKIVEGRDCGKADFSVPAHGLFLIAVNYK
ncbi:MAG TPA: tRNA pseudouridine(38-40) synthase TruA [Hanamia sp.]|nr:tRNA pseudouridine(38-40) synthase TruA [Hanamia sp.]